MQGTLKFVPNDSGIYFIPGRDVRSCHARCSAAFARAAVHLLPSLTFWAFGDSRTLVRNYAKLPPPVMMQAGAVEMIAAWLVQRPR